MFEIIPRDILKSEAKRLAPLATGEFLNVFDFKFGQVIICDPGHVNAPLSDPIDVIWCGEKP